MLFKEVLEKNGLTEETVSHGLKVKISRYNKLVVAVEEAREQLKEAKTPKKRVGIEDEIKRGEENLAAMNDEISSGVEKYAANRELNEKKAANLALARASKINGSDPKPVSTPKAAPAVPVQETPAAVPEEEKPKKKSNAGAIIGGIILAGVLGFLGYKYVKKD